MSKLPSQMVSGFLILTLSFLISSLVPVHSLSVRSSVVNGSDDVKGSNVTFGSGISPTGNVTSSRNSRQLWSLLQNVVKQTKESGNNNKPLTGGTLGSLASSFIGNLISNGINSNLGSSVSSNQNVYSDQASYNPYQSTTTRPITNANDYMHYLLLNSQSNQHSSLPHYQNQKFEQSTSDLIEKYKEEMTSSSSAIGDSATSTTNLISTGNQILNKLALGSIFDDFENLSNFLSFGSFERMVDKVNKFDKLKCIPRLLCQMVAKRQEDARIAESSTTAKPKTKRKSDDEDEMQHDESDKRGRNDDDDEKVNVKKSQSKNEDEKESGEEESGENNDEEEDDEDDSEEEKEYEVIKAGQQTLKRQGVGRTARLFKINGGEIALEQFVKFLEIMQLKDWSLYPYIKGAYEGHQVTRSDDCASKFSSCPFSDEQLVYYFNNYNGGFFQSI